MAQLRPQSVVARKSRQREKENGARRAPRQIELTFCLLESRDQAADLQEQSREFRPHRFESTVHALAGCNRIVTQAR
jgi:hypothetical protein